MNFLLNVIDNAKWTNDCCGKQDLDFNILQCSTRYYRDYIALPSFICYDYTVDDYITILGVDIKDCIKGNSEEETKYKVKEWYKNNLVKAIEILLDIAKKENKIDF